RHLQESGRHRDALQCRRPRGAGPLAAGGEPEAPAGGRGAAPAAGELLRLAGQRQARGAEGAVLRRTARSPPGGQLLSPESSSSASASIVRSSSRAIAPASRLASIVALGERPDVSTTTRGWEVAARRCNSSASSQMTLK